MIPKMKRCIGNRRISSAILAAIAASDIATTQICNRSASPQSSFLVYGCGLFIVLRPNDSFKTFGHFLKGVVPTKVVGPEPVRQSIAVVIPKPVPIAIARPLNLPKELSLAHGTDTILYERHRQAEFFPSYGYGARWMHRKVRKNADCGQQISLVL